MLEGRKEQILSERNDKLFKARMKRIKLYNEMVGASLKT